MGPRLAATTLSVLLATGLLAAKTMAFVLLVQGNPAPGNIAQVDTFRAMWQLYGNGDATGGRGRFDTVLNPKVH